MERYAVIGHPIDHSLSPLIHQQFASLTGQNLRYERLLAPLDGFTQTVQQFMSEGGRGLNVTVPFKLEAFALANQLTARAKTVGVVNTLSFENGIAFGDNTDGVGLVNDLTQNLNFPLTDKKILLLGAGGAARGVIAPLLEQFPKQLVINNRTAEKARELAEVFKRHGPVEAFDRARHGAFDLVINATSASLHHEIPYFDYASLAPQALVYDMMYGKVRSLFLQAAAQLQHPVCDGLGMLVEQAAESFFIWRNVRPPTAPVLSSLRHLLAQG